MILQILATITVIAEIIVWFGIYSIDAVRLSKQGLAVQIIGFLLVLFAIWR
jgi:hypothetical protein